MKPPTPGSDAVSLRVTPKLKRDLEAAAIASGRSLSQETELRLEQSFEREFCCQSLRHGYERS